MFLIVRKLLSCVYALASTILQVPEVKRCLSVGEYDGIGESPVELVVLIRVHGSSPGSEDSRSSI